MKIRISVIKQYLFMLLLIMLSGNPFFQIGSVAGQYMFTVLVVIIACFNLSFFKSKSAKAYFIYLISFLVIFLLQYYVLKFVSIPGILGFILKLTLAYIVIRRLEEKFRYVYFNWIFAISLISVLGFSLNNLDFDIPNLLSESNDTRSIIFFTQKFDGTRNSGMFWEPGAFACYILLSFLLYAGELRLLLKENRFKVFIVVLALLTTFSTTGYILMFILIAYTLMKEYTEGSKLLIIPLILFFFVGSYFFFIKTEFLSEKVNTQYNNALENDGGEFSPDRFGAFMFDLYYIEKHPLIGNGLHSKTRYADHPILQDEPLGHGNGFSNFIASMGFLSLIVYIIFILKYKNKDHWIFILGIITLLQGEQLMNYPLFLSLPLIFTYAQKNSNTFNMS